MTQPTLEKARLWPLDRSSGEPDEDNVIVLDFNPETLAISVRNSLEKSGGSQARQTVKETVSSLRFDAVFDSTHATVVVETPEDLDIRKRTGRLVALLGQGSSEQPSDASSREPARVRFGWGTIVFDGVFASYSETLDFFSPEGIPLRARVSIELTEQEFQYRREPRDQQVFDRMARGAAGESAGRERPAAQEFESWSVADAADSPAGSGSGATLGAGLGASLSLDVEFGFEAGVEAELGVELGVGLAAEVFGSGLFGAGAVDLAPAVSTSSNRAASDLAPTAGPWAPAGPVPGTAGARIAAQVARERVRNPAPPGATTFPDGLAPLAGAPPTRAPSFGPPLTPVFANVGAPVALRAFTGPRPTWEGREQPSRDAATAESCCDRCGKSVTVSRSVVPRQRGCRCGEH